METLIWLLCSLEIRVISKREGKSLSRKERDSRAKMG
jgi:hypothetical protein